MTKLKIADPELKSGTEELYSNILKATGKKAEDSDNEMEGVGDNDDSFETVSEEDISDDEDVQMKD